MEFAVTNKKKERSDMILEPLQVMVQLALLKYCPIGTKVSVADNILQLQFPTMFQGVWRWYHQDGKDDLYYLFHAIRRYYKWYKNQNTKIYSFILQEAISGLENLMITYEKCEQTSIIHTLQLYKNVLGMESPDLFKENTEETINIDKVYIIGNGPKKALKKLNIITKTHKINDKIRLNFVELIDVINAFDINNYELDENIRNTKNGDIMETYICNWQKTK